MSESGAEYKEGIDESKVEPYVTVMETSELDVIPVLKTALESAGIPVRTRGEGLMSLFPSEALGATFRSSAGEVRIQVPESRAEEARELLSTTATVEDLPESEEGAESTDD